MFPLPPFLWTGLSESDNFYLFKFQTEFTNEATWAWSFLEESSNYLTYFFEKDVKG